jgi:hypothetical protein
MARSGLPSSKRNNFPRRTRLRTQSHHQMMSAASAIVERKFRASLSYCVAGARPNRGLASAASQSANFKVSREAYRRLPPHSACDSGGTPSGSRGRAPGRRSQNPNQGQGRPDPLARRDAPALTSSTGRTHFQQFAADQTRPAERRWIKERTRWRRERRRRPRRWRKRCSTSYLPCPFRKCRFRWCRSSL